MSTSDYEIEADVIRGIQERHGNLTAEELSAIDFAITKFTKSCGVIATAAASDVEVVTLVGRTGRIKGVFTERHEKPEVERQITEGLYQIVGVVAFKSYRFGLEDGKGEVPS